MSVHKKHLTRQEASAFLRDEFGCSYAVSTLAKLVSVGGGPPLLRIGRRVFYTRPGLTAWISAKTVEVTR